MKMTVIGLRASGGKQILANPRVRDLTLFACPQVPWGRSKNCAAGGKGKEKIQRGT